MSDMQNNLFGSIESIVNRVIESTPIDTTITAEIALVQNADIGAYKVTYKGDTFSAKALDPAVIYKKGEDVYVLVPKGDFSATKVILGKAAFNDTVTYADRQTMSNQWKTRGPNWLSNQWYWRDNTGKYRSDNQERKAGIIATTPGEEDQITGGAGNPPSWREYVYFRDADANPSPDEPVLSPMRQNKITRPLAINRPNLPSLQKVDKEFQVYANAFEHVMISADFETNFSMVHFSGEYGILVECWTANPKFGKENYPGEPERIITTLRFSFNDFNGAPYQFNQSTPQRAVFPVPKGVLKGLVRVCLFQDDGWNTDIVPIYTKPENPDAPDAKPPEVSFDPAKGAKPVRDRNNIFAKNISIHWCEGIKLEDSLFWLRIDAPRGTTVYNAQGSIPANPSIPLEARLFYGSEEVTSKDTCKFMWFRQKYSATMDKVDKDKDKDEYGRTWYDYGGNGWAPIEKIMKPAADEPFFGESANGTNQYSFKDPTWQQTLNVGIEVVPWQWKYKVVCVYNPTPNTLEDKLERGSKEVVLFETEIVTNSTSIHDFELPLPMVSNDLLTTYIRTRNNNLPWEERVADDPQNPNNPSATKDWWCRWWMETPSGLYEPVPHTGSPRFQKGKISINDYLHYDAITFKAQIFGKKNPTGATQETKIGDAAQIWPWPAGPDQSKEQNEYEIANIERTLLKSEDLLLLVDWDGITNHSYNSDGSILLQSSVGAEFPLRAILHWSDSSIMDYSVEWIAPDGSTPLRHHSTYPGGNAVGSGFAMNDSMMYDMWVGADNIIRYKVQQKYDINKTKNTFTLRVTLIDGRIFEYHKEITFVKAGQNGTQGSEWEARIWPTNDIAQVGGPNGVGFERYTEEIRMYPRPLVINGNFSGVGNLTRNPNFQLFLRPFIYKNGKRIEELADKDEYSYKVYWDSRYPNLKNSTLTERYAARNGSFLKFVKFNGQAPDSGSGIGITSPTGILDMQARTASTDRNSGAPTGDKTYGAIEVQWRDQRTCGQGATVSGVGYDFTIKAQVDIYKHDTLVATIFSYWPVDILFTNGNPVTPTTFDVNKIKTNWPQFVMYNPSGYAPEVSQDFLRFFYGEKAWNEFDPLPFTATPINLTETIQTIKQESTRDKKSWRLYPRPFYFFEECANGAMRTDFTLDIGDAGWTNPNPDVNWNKCTYVRPIVYMINSFGNTDINGWDGKSIDINDERGTIFAPTIGAGYKDPFSNKFNGVIMGIDSSQSKQSYQNIFGGFSDDDLKKRPYMTGLFGYQDGVSSFGIMENGTAYFGRADRGGRIIIDGYNAQIYGGLKGDMHGGTDMDMSNRMRLSFIDFDSISYSQGISETDNRSSLETDGIRVNTGSFDVRKFFPYFSPVATEGTTALARAAGFGSGRGAGTPAIEIGSYKEYILTGGKGDDLIRHITPEEASKWYDSLKDLEIPGYRKFLVNYDGTLFAMNAFIKGNIVGSNIVASNFYNKDGTFGVTEDGNMWVGKKGNRFKEYFVEHTGVWSKIIPELYPEMGVSEILRSNNTNITGLPVNDEAAIVYDQVNTPFFVASDGRVFCKEIHISGESSINIGGFHVLPKKYGGGKAGDVVSFGTMYLVGPDAYSGQWGSSGPAVEAWGDFYLRGELVNLGKVFLGGSFEKTIGGSAAAKSLNSPFSISPSEGTPGTDSPNPHFPVEMGMWPLYFYNGPSALDRNKNDAWVCLPQSDKYMSPFGSKRTAQDFTGTGESELSKLVTWRIDQNGMWTDGIFFTNYAWNNMDPGGNDQKPLSYNGDGFLYQGWWTAKGKGSSGFNTRGFVIKNAYNDGPNITIESPKTIRLSSGKKGRNGAVAGPSIILDSFTNGGTARKALLTVNGDQDSFSAGAGLVMISGRKAGRSAMDTTIGDIEAFLSMNTIGWAGTTGGDEVTVKDELGYTVDIIPGRNPNTNGFIWMKGRSVAIDGNQDAGQITQNALDACFRLNRTYNGLANSIVAPFGWTAIPFEGPVGKGLAAIQGNAAVNILTDVTGWIKLEVSSGGKMFAMKSDKLQTNYTPEQQFGIYARFG